MDLYIGRSATDRSLWWISEHHDRQLQLPASRATKAEVSALQCLVALPPFTALRSKAAIPWASHTPATLQSFRGPMPSWPPVMLAFSASRPCKFEWLLAFDAVPSVVVVELHDGPKPHLVGADTMSSRY